MPSPTTPLLTHAQRQALYDVGYHVTAPLFEATALEELRGSIDEVWRRQIELTNPNDAVASRNIRQRPFLSGYHQLAPQGRRFLRRPPLTDLALQLIGQDVDVPNNQIVIKPPMKDWQNTFAWHQDDYYIKDNASWNVPIVSDLKRCLQGWLALTPTTIDNGTLWVQPGRHKEGLLPHTYSRENGEWVMDGEQPRAEPGGGVASGVVSGAVAGAMPVELEPGQMLIFSGLLPHTSGPNRTRDQTRMVYQFTYTQVGGATGEFVLPVLRGGRVMED